MLNMDFSLPVVIDTHAMDWAPSPLPGVWRKPLAREEAERGHATSIVRYEPGASFKRHDHPGGEEILVLGGTFSDATGDFPAGTYFRNPMGFVHAPYSREGCVILVKLHQFQAEDDSQVNINTHTDPGWEFRSDSAGRLLLHAFGQEQVGMERWPAGFVPRGQAPAGGEEIYVVTGRLTGPDRSYPAGTWLRHPRDGRPALRAGQDSLLWIKTGHLVV